MAAHPTKIMIIRHAEKPAKSPEDGFKDVLVSGESGGGKSLIVPGWQRAGALNAFFAPYKSRPANAEIAKPDCIYAANPVGGSARPWETVTPLAAWLGYKQGSAKFNTDFRINGGEAQLVESVLSLDGVVLICWEHKNIMPNIMQAIDKGVPISNYDSLPQAWPDVFYLVWVLDLNGKSYKWTSVNQNLIAGDVSE